MTQNLKESSKKMLNVYLEGTYTYTFKVKKILKINKYNFILRSMTTL